MINMRIESKSGKGDFNLIANEEVICTLAYENWFSSKATADLPGQKLEIKPNNIWGARFLISRNAKEAGEIMFNWKGDIIITFSDIDNVQNSFIMKAKGLWKLRFEVYDQKENLIFIMASKSRWNKFNYDYEIEFSDTGKPDAIPELPVCCGYAANLYVEMISSGS